MTSVAIWLGTLILYLPAPHGAYLSADSRYDGGDPARRDEAQKIFLCGKAAVCAISGGLRMDVTGENGKAASFDLQALTAAASAEMLASADQRPEALVNLLRGSITPRLQQFWNSYLAGRRVTAPLSQRLGAASLFTLLLAAEGAGPGEPVTLVQIMFPFREQRLGDGTWVQELREPVTRVADASRPLAQGRTDCMRIRPDQPPDTGTREATLATMEGLYGRAQEVAACEAVIGGAIDIAVIENGAARWLRRKPAEPSTRAGTPRRRIALPYRRATSGA